MSDIAFNDGDAVVFRKCLACIVQVNAVDPMVLKGRQRLVSKGWDRGLGPGAGNDVRIVRQCQSLVRPRSTGFVVGSGEFWLNDGNRCPEAVLSFLSRKSRPAEMPKPQKMMSKSVDVFAPVPY